MCSSTGGCKIEKLPAISSSLRKKNELTGNHTITKPQEGKVEISTIIKASQFHSNKCAVIIRFVPIPFYLLCILSYAAGNNMAFTQVPSVAPMTTTFRESYRGLYGPPAPNTK